jgi:hypothetical protein
VQTAVSSIPSSSRGWIHAPGNDGFIKLIADADAGMLIGATSAGPAGGEVLGALAVAVHARVPVAVLSQMIYAYPTFHRAIEDAITQLSLRRAGSIWRPAMTGARDARPFGALAAPGPGNGTLVLTLATLTALGPPSAATWEAALGDLTHSLTARLTGPALGQLITGRPATCNARASHLSVRRPICRDARHHEHAA